MNTQNIKSANSETFILLFLSLISAFGPIVTDLYLPALPQMNAVFNTTTSSVQLSITVSLIGLALGQLFFGPISDKYGRKKPLLISLVLFIITTTGCVFSKNIETFIAFRLFQGIAGAGGIVISKSIAVDFYKGEKLAKFLSLMASVQGLAPILAPMAGGFLLKVTDWQGIFVVLLFIGIIFLAASFFYKESLAENHRLKDNILGTFKHFLPILKNKKIMYYTLALSFAMEGFFGYLSASPYIFQDNYQLSPLAYAVCFAVNALGFIAGSLSVRVFKTSKQAIIYGSTGFLVATVLLAISLSTAQNVFVIEALFFFMLFNNGIIVPTTTTLALNLERKTAGNASAVLGSLQFLFGGIVSPLVGLGNVNLSTSIALTICSILCGVFIIAGLRKKENSHELSLVYVENKSV